MIVHSHPPSPSPRVHPRTDHDTLEVPHRLDGLTVLAVDDEEDALILLREIIEAAGAAVVTAASGSRALQLLQASSPDVLIADVGMPEMDGFEGYGETGPPSCSVWPVRRRSRPIRPDQLVWGCACGSRWRVR